jgi:hypothetical protein
MLGLNENSSMFAARLSTFDGVNRSSITQVLSSELYKDARYTVKLSRVFLLNLIILSPTPLAEPDNCIACNRDVSLVTWFNSSGVVGWYHVRVSRHKKNSQVMERTKALSPISLGYLYTGAPKSKFLKVKISGFLETVKHLFCLEHIQGLTAK